VQLNKPRFQPATWSNRVSFYFPLSVKSGSIAEAVVEKFYLVVSTGTELALTSTRLDL
jgi:hypothetical protein